MNTYIALLRGINVGGKNKLPMKTLIQLLETLGAKSVQSYIQSGNIVFQHECADTDDLSRHISSAIDESQGFRPAVLVITRNRLERAITSNPFPHAVTEPKKLHIYFLVEVPPAPNLEKLEALRSETESFELVKDHFYLHAPNGIGRSKLAAKAENLLDVVATARNWRTVSKLQSMSSDPR